MPTATSFTALGRGNGFNRCLSKRNVESYDYWTTLSGWNKNNTPATAAAKAQSIADSHALAMSMYWNLYQVTGSATATYNADAVSVSAVTVGIYNATPNSSNATAIEPKDRACISGGLFSQDIDQVANVESYMQSNTNPAFFQKLYNGDQTDEANFVGYGLAGEINAVGRMSGLGSASVRLQDKANNNTSASYDFAYVSLNGVNFVCEAYGDTPNAAAMTSSRSGSSGSNSWNFSASISSLAFWTY